MKKLFVVADVHSYFDEMMKALNAAGFDKDNADHIFVSCGDLLDRGKQTLECLSFVNSLPNKILIEGNHEDLLIDIFNRNFITSTDRHNGTENTILQLSNSSDTIRNNVREIKIAIAKAWENPEIKTYLNNCIDYYEVGKYIFVHGWIPIGYEQTEDWQFYGTPCYDSDWRDSFSWPEARWLNGMSQWSNGIREPDKTIVCGHWHSSYGNSRLHNEGTEFGEDANFKPFVDDGIIALDACTAYSGFVNCVVLEVEDNEYHPIRNKS